MNLILITPILIAVTYATFSQAEPICIVDTSDQSNLICKDISTVFPNKMYYGNKNLQCHKCNIRVFTSSTFNSDNVLLSINISNSELQSIQTWAFQHLGNVQNIYFQNNEISTVESGAFAGLRQVYEINLANNLIVKLIPGFVKDLEVTYFSVADNLIEEIPDRVFEDVLIITNLILSGNKIKKLNYDSFYGLESTEYLELDNNELCYLPIGTFRNMKDLSFLNLANNKLQRFPMGTFSGLNDLSTLILANNSIRTIDGSEFLPMQRLTRLDIKGNNIYYLDAHLIYSSVPTLKYISLENNIYGCASLINTIQYFKEKKVTIDTQNGYYDVQNLNGVACVEDDVNEYTDKQKFLKVASDQAKRSVMYCA